MTTHQHTRIHTQVTNAVVLRAFPEYHRIHDEVHVHITHVPIVDKLRDLREVRTLGKHREDSRRLVSEAYHKKSEDSQSRA